MGGSWEDPRQILIRSCGDLDEILGYLGETYGKFCRNLGEILCISAGDLGEIVRSSWEALGEFL